jgi:hypothetical protein
MLVDELERLSEKAEWQCAGAAPVKAEDKGVMTMNLSAAIQAQKAA